MADNNTPETTVVKTFKVIGVILASAAGLYIAYRLRDIIFWLIIGAFIAVVINPAVSGLARHMPKGRRGYALFIVMLGLTVALIGFGILCFAPLVTQSTSLVKNWPNIATDLSNKLSTSSSQVVQYLSAHGGSHYIESSKANFTSAISNFVVGSVSRVFSLVGSIAAMITILVMAAYLSVNGPKYWRLFTRRVPATKRADVGLLVAAMYRAITGYITGTLTTSVIAGVSAGLLATLVGVPYAAVLGLVVGIADLIPLVGAQLGAIIVILVALSKSPAAAIVMLVFFILYQAIENYWLTPKIMSHTVALSPMAVFVFILCGAALGGFIGAIVAIPIGACLVITGDYLLGGTAWAKD